VSQPTASSFGTTSLRQVSASLTIHLGPCLTWSSTPAYFCSVLFLDLLGGLQSHRVQHSRDLFAQSLPAGGPEFLAPFDSLRDDTEKMNGSVVFTIAFGRIAFAEPCIRQRRSLLYVYCTFEKLKVRQCVREPRDHHQSLRCRPSKIGAVLSEHKSAARSMPTFDAGRFRSPSISSKSAEPSRITYLIKSVHYKRCTKSA
jgi:hypothetical protein